MATKRIGGDPKDWTKFIIILVIASLIGLYVIGDVILKLNVASPLLFIVFIGLFAGIVLHGILRKSMDKNFWVLLIVVILATVALGVLLPGVISSGFKGAIVNIQSIVGYP